MKSILFASLLVISNFSISAQTKAKTPLVSEQMRFAAQISLDTDALQDLLTDDLIYIHSNALTETKSDFIASVQSGKIVYASMQAEAGSIVRQKGKSAIITGVVAVGGSYKGTPFEIRLRYTSVYQKQRGHWKLASWQSLKLLDE